MLGTLPKHWCWPTFATSTGRAKWPSGVGVDWPMWLSIVGVDQPTWLTLVGVRLFWVFQSPARFFCKAHFDFTECCTNGNGLWKSNPLFLFWRLYCEPNNLGMYQSRFYCFENNKLNFGVLQFKMQKNKIKLVESILNPKNKNWWDLYCFFLKSHGLID